MGVEEAAGRHVADHHQGPHGRHDPALRVVVLGGAGDDPEVAPGDLVGVEEAPRARLADGDDTGLRYPGRVQLPDAGVLEGREGASRATEPERREHHRLLPGRVAEPDDVTELVERH